MWNFSRVCFVNCYSSEVPSYTSVKSFLTVRWQVSLPTTHRLDIFHLTNWLHFEFACRHCSRWFNAVQCICHAYIMWSQNLNNCSRTCMNLIRSNHAECFVVVLSFICKHSWNLKSHGLAIFGSPLAIHLHDNYLHISGALIPECNDLNSGKSVTYWTDLLCRQMRDWSMKLRWTGTTRVSRCHT